jgi:acetolactate synthase regulatory subunit
VTEKIYDSELKINNYSLIRTNSHSCHTGGLSVYVRAKINHEIISSKQCGSNWFSAVKTYENKKCIYGTLYHSPSSSDAEFIDLFDNWCEELFEKAENCNIIITGDFNIDFSRPSFYQKKLQMVFEAYGLKQMTKDMTRVTETSQSMIDLVLTNNKSITVLTSNEDKISDHETLKIYVDETGKNCEVEKKETLSWKNYSKDALQSELRKYDWDMIGKLSINEKAKTINECLIKSVNGLLVKKTLI